MLSLQLQDAVARVIPAAADPHAFVRAVIDATNRCAAYLACCADRDLPVPAAIGRKVDAFVSSLRRLLKPGQTPLNRLDFEQLQNLGECFCDEIFEGSGLDDSVNLELDSFGDDGERRVGLHVAPAPDADQAPVAHQLAQIQKALEDAVDEVSACASMPYDFLSAACDAVASYRQGLALCEQHALPVPARLSQEWTELREVLAYHSVSGALPLAGLDMSQLGVLHDVAAVLESEALSSSILDEYRALAQDFSSNIRLLDRSIRLMADEQLAQVAAVSRRAGLQTGGVGGEIVARGMESRAPRLNQERNSLKAEFARAVATATHPGTPAAELVDAVVAADRLHESYMAHCEQDDAPIAVRLELRPALMDLHNTLRGLFIAGHPPLNKLTDRSLVMLSAALPPTLSGVVDQESDQLAAAHTASMNQIASLGMVAMSDADLKRALEVAVRREARNETPPAAIHAHLLGRRDAWERGEALLEAADTAIGAAPSHSVIVRAVTGVATQWARYTAICTEHGLPIRSDVSDRLARLRSVLLEVLVPGAGALVQLDLSTVPEFGRALTTLSFADVAQVVAREILRVQVATRVGLTVLGESGLDAMELAQLRELRDNLQRIEPISPILRMIKERISRLEDQQQPGTGK